MKKHLSTNIYRLSISALLLVFVQGFFFNVKAQIAVHGETVWTMAGEPISNGIVLIGANGKIEAVGTTAQVRVPANYRTISAKVVTPGLIDARSVVGLAGYLNQPHDQMQVDASAPMQPELRAIDAYNPEERLIEWIRSFGVTTIHTGHAPASLISGQTMIAKTFGNTVEEVTLVPTAMIAATLGQGGLAGQGRSPGTRAKQAAMLRAELIKAQEAVRKADAARKPQPNQPAQPGQPNQPNNDNPRVPSNAQPSSNTDISPNVSNPNSMLENPPTPAYRDNANQASTPTQPVTDLRGDMMQKIVRREIPLLVTAHLAQDIMTALRIAREFNIRIVLDGASDAHLLINEIKASGFPVIIHPTMYRAGGETENLSMETASKLRQAGIPVAMQSGYETYVPKTRVVLFEAGIAAANGLSMRDALATVTIDAARILGIDRRVGSLEVGKDADLAMYDGDPFEFTTHCIGTIINGRVVSETVR